MPEFNQAVTFEIIDSLKNNSRKYLLISDDSCEKTWNSSNFVLFTTTGKRPALNNFYFEHNLFNQNKLGRDVEL